MRLVAESMHVFAESVKEKSMAKFHSHISNLWQSRFTVDKLDKAFGAFYGMNAELTVLDNYSPQFSSKPTIDDNGVLVIAGYYPTKPNQVYFQQKCIMSA